MAEPRPDRAEGRVPGSRGDRVTCAAVREARVPRIPEDAAYAGTMPARCAHGGRHVEIAESFCHAIERGRCLGIGVPGKDLGDDGRFDRIKPEPLGITGTRGIKERAIGGPRPGKHLAATDFGLAPTAHALGDPRAFLFRYGP